MGKERNLAIDIMKFFAAIAITNSHMGDLYVHFNGIATGGAIGDAIFFFCSGFTLFLGQERRFDNWYKRRIRRIYPTVIMWAIITAFLIDEHYSVRDSILYGGGWFVSCIMVYYILIYFTRKIFKNRLWMAFVLYLIVTIGYYYYSDSHLLNNFYGDGTFRLVFFFLIMLLGAIFSLHRQSFKLKLPGLWFILLFAGFYGILFIKNKFSEDISAIMNLFTIPCLAGMCISLYYFCESSLVGMMDSRIGLVVRFIGGLCLQIYVVQHAIITTSFNFLFPLNLIIVFLAIVFTAYLLQCFSRFFLQTFDNQDYNWKEIMRLV